jgi:hypothetical protein
MYHPFQMHQTLDLDATSRDAFLSEELVDKRFPGTTVSEHGKAQLV